MPYCPLICTQSLSDIINQENLVLLDASIPAVGGGGPKPAGWPETAIKGARRFDLKGEFSDQQSELSHTMPDQTQFQQAARALGVNNESQIVVYDDLGIYSSARAWWMFKAMGHQNIAVLDGGLPKWLAEQREVEQAKTGLPELGNFIAKPQPGVFSQTQDVLAAIDNPDKVILDARAEQRFLGTSPEPRAGLRSGHIPSAKNLPYQQLLTQGQLLAKEVLQRKFKSVATNEQELVFSCGSGITACILALGAQVAGYEKLSVYDGSWAEWGIDPKLPIA